MLIVYCLHGDEIVSETIAKKINKEFNIEILLGNPRAREKNVRFIETDLNRSFNKKESYEATRAQELKELLSKENLDLIVDLHTTTSIMPPTAIITDLKQLKMAARLGFQNIIFMNKQFSNGGSLIENVDNAISVEISTNVESIDFVEKSLIKGLSPELKTREFNIYEVVDIIKKEDNIYGDVKNLKQLPDGYYPAFYGEKSYKDIAYLKTKRYILTI